MGRKCCSSTSTVIPFVVTNFVGTMSAARPREENPQSHTVAMISVVESERRA